jgi:hypothetical protein
VISKKRTTPGAENAEEKKREIFTTSAQRHKAEGTRQKAQGKKVCTVNFLTFFNCIVIFVTLH